MASEKRTQNKADRSRSILAICHIRRSKKWLRFVLIENDRLTMRIYLDALELVIKPSLVPLHFFLLSH